MCVRLSITNLSQALNLHLQSYFLCSLQSLKYFALFCLKIQHGVLLVTEHTNEIHCKIHMQIEMNLNVDR